MSFRRQELAPLGSLLEWLNPSEAVVAYKKACRIMKSASYGLDPQSVADAEHFEIRGDLSAATNWLQGRIGKLRCRVLIVYSEVDVARLEMPAFVCRWSELFGPARDDVVILPEADEWAIFYCHDDWFEYGRTHAVDG